MSIRDVGGLGVVHLDEGRLQRFHLLQALLGRGFGGLLAEISEAVPTIITLPYSRVARPLVRRMMSSAWSQGTSCRRRVMLPFTLSETTMFLPLASARICSTARMSMLWKLRLIFWPAYCFLAAAGLGGRGRAA